jgi:hypothetical protein
VMLLWWFKIYSDLNIYLWYAWEKKRILTKFIRLIWILDIYSRIQTCVVFPMWFWLSTYCGWKLLS